jgi:hypothetical protein
MSRKKLKALKCKEVKILRENIDQLRAHNDAYGLESLVRPYRA